MRQLTALAALMTCAAAAPAGFIASESAADNAGSATFTIHFTGPQDFFTTDVFGRQRDSFQYYVDAADAADPGRQFGVVIRGEEIHLGGEIVARERFGGSADPGSGGWGAALGAANYTLSGDTLTFTLSYATLGVADGNFSYSLDSLTYGANSSVVNVNWPSGGTRPIGVDTPSDPVTVPTPGTLALACVGAAAVMGSSWGRSRRRKS